MTKVYKRVYTNEHTSDLIEIKPEDIDFNGKTLLCLPGQYAIGNKIIEEEHLNPQMREIFGGSTFDDLSPLKVTTNVSGFLKIAQRIIGGKQAIDNGYNLVSATYEDTSDNRITLHNMEMYNKDPETFFSEQAAKFAVKTLVPLIGKNLSFKEKYKNTPDGSAIKTGWTTRGRRLSLKEAKENLSKVTLFAYSYGGTFAGELCNVLNKCGRELGYSQIELDEMLEQVKLVSIGNTMQSKNRGIKFTTIVFEADNDLVVRSNIPNFVDIVDRNKKYPFVEKPQDNILRIVTSNPIEKYYYPYNNDKSPSEPLLEKSDSTPSGPKAHKIRLYSSYSPNSDNLIPTLIENCVKNMMANISVSDIKDYTKFSGVQKNVQDAFKVVRKIYQAAIDDLFGSNQKEK